MAATPKIIVVDDEPRICENVEKILRKSNFEVTRALSAQEALSKMAQESYALLISDIVMPEMNGLELLKLVKKQWPLTKALMMTAYASTDTAIKAIRLGALDYLPKPFTPSELRTMVDHAMAGKLVETKVSRQERESINVIDVDVPFDQDEVAQYTGEDYAERFGRSDMPVVEVRASEPLEGYCQVGNMVCDIFKKLGATCKAGTKTAKCPQLAKKAKAAAGGAAHRTDVKRLIGIDQPFDYEEVRSVTGPEYISYLRQDGVVVPTYEELKANVARMNEQAKIDVDMPFDSHEVAQATGEIYVRELGRGDMPVVEVTASQDVEGFCEVGAMVCDIFKKLGATCKAGTKTAQCPQLAKKRRAAKAAARFDAGQLISPDLPFDYQEVAAVAGPDYIDRLIYDGAVQLPYEQLKENYTRLLEREAAEQQALKAFAAAPASRHILVIDDEVAVNNNIRKILAKNDYHVDQAVSKDEALEKLRGRPYTLVLLDLKVPGVKGFELLESVRQHQPAAKVIMITGYASIETAVTAARMGVIDYLPKPFTPDEIRGATDRDRKSVV